MTPDELAKANNEHSHQRALFAWAGMAERHGFEAAWDERSYSAEGFAALAGRAGVSVIRYLHAIPNGGPRDGATAAKLKAEGVKPGVPDAFLPLPRGMWAGLYVEMKRPGTEKTGKRKAVIVDRAAGSTSGEQNEWIGYLRSAGYGVAVAFNWREAAKQIQSYVEYPMQAVDLAAE
jgi:hypothetical protein